MKRALLGVVMIGMLVACGSRLDATKNSLRSKVQSGALTEPPGLELSPDACSVQAVKGRLQSKEVLATWIDMMRAQGMRVAGNASHLEYIKWIKAQLTAAKFLVTDYPVLEDTWAPTKYEFATRDSKGVMTIRPTASYYTFSGSGTVTGKAVVVSQILGKYNWTAAAGKIAVVKQDFRALTLGQMAQSPQWLQDLIPSFDRTAPFIQLPSLAVSLPDLSDGWLGVTPGAAGVLGVVVASDLPEAAVAGNYTAFQKPTLVPAVLLGGDGRAFALDAVAKKLDVRLSTAAVVGKATVNSMIATIPGSDPALNSLILVTHTDGPNEVEENGGLALISLGKAIAGCNRRTVKLVFASGHMHYQGYDSGETLSVDPGQYRNLKAPGQPINTIGAISIEHLGGKHFAIGSGGALVESGQGADPLMVLTSKTDPKTLRGYADHLTKAYIAAATANALDRTFVAGLSTAGLGVLFGEGIGPDKLHIRTLGFVPLPEYLVKESSSTSPRLVNLNLMVQEIGVFAEMVKELQRSDYDGFGGY